jgi:hypothetical protein
LRDWVLGLLGGNLANATAQKEYYVVLPSNYVDRKIDVYFSDSSTRGWLNETKIGKQYDTNAHVSSEVKRDRYMINNNGTGSYCHPEPNGTCAYFPVNGDTWWFRYNYTSPCQMSFIGASTGVHPMASAGTF